MLSRKSKYGLKALLTLATEQGQGPVLVKDLADRDAIPKKFLEAILREMKSAGILTARPGKGGGYGLKQSPETINLGRVIRLIDGPLAPIPCVSQTAYARCDDCLDEKTCVIRLLMREVRDATARILDETTLAQLLEQEKRLAAPGGSIDFMI